MVSSGDFSKKPTAKIGDFALRKKGREKTWMARVINCCHQVTWGRGATGPSPPPPPPHTHFNFRTKKGLTVSVPNIRDISFAGIQKLYELKISYLPCMLQFLDNLRQLFIFFNYIEEIDTFTLDLLK